MGNIAVLPVATYDEDADQTICSRTETRNLKDDLRSIPLACTFGIFDKWVIWLWDRLKYWTGR